jgi:hypothetical protein
MLEFTVIRSIAKVFLWLDYNFLPAEEMAKIVGEEDFMKLGGPEFYNQDIETVLKQYSFQPMGSSTTAVKEVRIQQIMQAFQIFNNDPLINQIELRKMVFDALDIKNENKLLVEPQAPMPGMPGMMPPGTEGTPPQGGPQPPQPPQPPKPGANTPPAEATMAEMMRIPGGGLLPRGRNMPQQAGAQQ